MNWLDRVVEKWYWLVGKVRPVWEVIKKVFSVIGNVFRIIWKFIYGVRGILVSVPGVFAAFYVASWAREHLPEAVEVTHVLIDREAEGAIFGLFVMTTELMARDLVIVSSLALTAVCLICTIFSKRTLYPWLISVFTLCLPIVMYYLNTYPM